MLAVIKTGGKQYIVSPNQIFKVEKIIGKMGDKIFLKDVLLFSDGKQIEIGKPLLAGYAAEAEILKQGRERKKIVFRYHSKTRYRKTKGHRQEYTQLKILNIRPVEKRHG